MTQIKVLSFNIRYLNEHDKDNIWDNRKKSVVDIIKKYNPGIIGFQEVVYEQLQYLKENLSDYSFYGVARDDGMQNGEFAPIFFKNTFKLVLNGTFWLSHKPNEPSRGWGSWFSLLIKGFLHKRIVSWVELEDESNKRIRVYNTHFPLKVYGRLNSINLISKKLQKLENKEIPIFFMGDFNFNPHSKEYSKMSNILTDSYILDKNNKDCVGPNEEITYHVFTGHKTLLDCPFKEGRIDYIWINDLIKTKSCKIITDNPNKNSNIYPTDHWQILGEFEY